MLGKMDIDKELNTLIFKYHIDEPFPNYEKYVKAYELVKTLYAKLQGNNQKMAFVSESWTDLKFMKSCICSKEERMIVFDLAILSGTSQMEICQDITYINVSQNHRDGIQLALKQSGAKVISIYNIFEQNGLYFQNPFFDIYNEEYLPHRGMEYKKDWDNFDINLYFFRHRRCYEISDEYVEKELYLKKIIFDCIIARDFLMLKFYVGKFQGEQREIYEEFYAEILKLLARIKNTLENHKNNVMILWLDALEYGEDADMEYLKEIEKCSVVFSNAFTVTPFTTPTFKTLFTARRVVEEESFRLNEVTEQESELLQELRDLGYGFQYYGILPLLDKEKTGASFVSYYTVISQSYWNALRDILLAEDEEKSVFVLHEMLQTHIPFISLGITGDIYEGRQAWPGQQRSAGTYAKQAKESRIYIDEQLRFYGNLLPKSTKKVYLSDHGHTTFGRFHTILKIQSEGIKPREISSLFSYVDFSKVLLEVIKTGDFDENRYARDYALVQDVDYYYKSYIEMLVTSCDFLPENMFGYQGVVTTEDMMLKYKNGVRFYLKHKNDGIMLTDERVAYLEKLISPKEISVWEEEKFEASRLLHSAWKKSSVRCKEEEKKKVQIILDTFTRLDENTVVAIRGGGMHTFRMLLLLPYHLRQKIRYIIDLDCECIAGKLGIQVVHPNQLEDYSVETIIISSFEYREMLRQELQLFKGQIIDIYEEFEKHGIICTKDFYRRTYLPEDFVQEA